MRRWTPNDSFDDAASCPADAKPGDGVRPTLQREAPWATETALLVVNVPAADFVSVPPTEMALPESVTAPAALPAETLPALIAAAVPESTATVAAESKATLSPMMNSMLGMTLIACVTSEA